MADVSIPKSYLRGRCGLPGCRSCRAANHMARSNRAPRGQQERRGRVGRHLRRASTSAGRRVLPRSERIRANPARSAPDRRARHDQEIERLNALAEAHQRAENRALGLYVSDTDEEEADCPREAYLDDLRTNQLLHVGSLVRPVGTALAPPSAADRRGSGVNSVGRVASTSRVRIDSYRSQLRSERAALREALGVDRGATAADDVERILPLLRGQVDAAHLYDSVRLSTDAAAQVLNLPAVGDREVQFIYELLLVTAVSDQGHVRGGPSDGGSGALPAAPRGHDYGGS